MVCFVLGKKDSEIYKKFNILYVELLVNRHELLCKNMNQIEGISEFLIMPQISSILNCLNRGENKKHLDQFYIQLDFFLKGDYSRMSDYQGYNIKNVNILLGDQDLNPDIDSDSHPDHDKEIIYSYGKKSEEEWLQVFSKTFGILKKVDKDFFDELDQNINKIIPFGTSLGVHNSCTFSSCIGQLYIGYTIDSPQPEINILEAIIHESSHNKLSLIMAFDYVIECNGEEKYYSAIRPDARPIRGVFLGYHAFVPTMYIIMKAYLGGYIKNKEEWLSKITLYYLKTKFLQRVIKKHARLSKIGKAIDTELDYVIGLSDILFKKIGPDKKYIKKAKSEQKSHFTEVNGKYSGLKY